MNTFTKKLTVFILPYICTSIFLFLFIKEKNYEFLYFALTASLFSLSCQLFLKYITKRYNSIYDISCPFCSMSYKTTKLLTGLFAGICAVIFIINLFGDFCSSFSMLAYLTALIYSLFPQTLLIFSYLLFFRNVSQLEKNEIKLTNPDIVDDILKSKILIIDKFDEFKNPEVISGLAEEKHVILISRLSRAEISAKYNKILPNHCFCDTASKELPAFSYNTVSIYPTSDINSVLPLIRLLNKSFITVSEEDMSTLCCRISARDDVGADITIPEKDLENIEAVFTLNKLMFNNYKKCLIYALTLNTAKLLCVMCCIFLCSHMPFTPLMLALTSLICDIFPPLSFIYDKGEREQTATAIREDLAQVLLDGCLLGLVNFIVFMAGVISFSSKCGDIICFNTYIISSLLYAFNLRCDKSVFLIGLLTNKVTNFAFFAGVSLSVIVSCFIYTEMSSFGAAGWLLIAAMAVIPFALTQLQKAAFSVFRK